MPAIIYYGDEFLINGATAGNQTDSHVAATATGDFVVTWTDATGDGSGSSVRATMWNGDSTLAVADSQVNVATAGNQAKSGVIGLVGGGFAIAWADDAATGGNRGVTLRLYEADSTPIGQPVTVAPGVDFPIDNPAIAALADGSCAVAYEALNFTGPDQSGTCIEVVIVDIEGHITGPVLVNTTSNAFQDDPRIAGLKGGNFVVVWTDGSSTGGDTSLDAVRGQVFSSSGVPIGGEFLVNTTTTTIQNAPDVTALAGGGFVVSWIDLSRTGGDDSSSSVKAQIYSANGTPLGGEFLVNATTAASQGEVSLTALPDGAFVACWADYSQTGDDTSGGAIRMQVFEPNGSPRGPELVVNSTTAGNQTDPSVSVLQDGRFVVTWTDMSATGGDTSGSAIRGQIIDARDRGIILDGTALADDYVGSRFRDKILGYRGDDGLQGGKLRDALKGGNGDDRLFGGSGSDKLDGGKGEDLLQGGKGNDLLIGGKGADRLTGWQGADIFILLSSADALGDRITDFEHGVDAIGLRDLMPGADFIGSAGFTGDGGAEVRYERGNGRLSGDVDGDGQADWALTLAHAPVFDAGDILV